ncbi:hypothetical protein IscW_ISCW021292 [Ixodes scapularis]|uniref:Uncharacterized protein n=1 Tax=Ixodes scapularis TaxID=6945 RepID=B7Q997_IXOSC|nr:hypothetical protein IscW_ISCW021292 [Ixodes scapularis]|eukprot:XP_002405673.1 hypothetical protein IscW_ISCW021292 [Ixodes scapularis]
MQLVSVDSHYCFVAPRHHNPDPKIAIFFCAFFDCTLKVSPLYIFTQFALNVKWAISGFYGRQVHETFVLKTRGADKPSEVLLDKEMLFLESGMAGSDFVLLRSSSQCGF